MDLECQYQINEISYVNIFNNSLIQYFLEFR
jgi:hypothetical protein